MRRLAGALALLAGAVLAVVGSLRPVYEQTRMDSGYRTGYRVTAWTGEYINPTGDVELLPSAVLFGVPVVVAAALLAVVAVAVLVVRLPARVVVGVRVVAVAAAALLIGSVWTVGQLVLTVMRENDPSGGSIETRMGIGTGLLVAACVAALAGVLLVRQRPTPVYQLPFDDDTDTPPMGVPIHPSVSTEESSLG